MQATKLTGLICDSMESALAGGMERFERRETDGSLEVETVLHDARTPLTIIVASVGFALRDAPGGVRPHLERALESARRLDEILVKGRRRLQAQS